MKIVASNRIATPAPLSITSRAVTPAASHDWPGLKESRRLQCALRDTPDVRAEAVARGKALIADPNYPSKEQIQSVAHVLAARWSRPGTRPVAARANIEHLA